MITKKSILEQIEQEKLDQLPGNLIEQEVKILSQGMKEDEVKKNQKSLEEQAKKRIKTGLILNAFGEENKINVSQEEINVEIQKQFRMMPGQEKIVKDYYEQNPAAIDSLRGQIYEEKIIEEIKKKAKITKKEITKEEAEKILKEENENNIKEQAKLTKKDEGEKNKKKIDTKKKEVKEKSKKTKETKTSASKPKKAKKVSKK
jgi:trigger factor